MTQEAGAPGAVDNGRGRAEDSVSKSLSGLWQFGLEFVLCEGNLPGGNGNRFDLAKRADGFVHRLALCLRACRAAAILCNTLKSNVFILVGVSPKIQWLSPSHGMHAFLKLVRSQAVCFLSPWAILVDSTREFRFLFPVGLSSYLSVSGIRMGVLSSKKPAWKLWASCSR